MKKLSLQTVAAVACALALNACSSGGGSTPSASSTPTPQQNQNQTEADKKAEAAKKAEELAKQKEAEAAKQAEELAKQQEAERKKAEEAKKAEELAKQQEAERKKAEEAKKAEELAKQQEAERKKAEEAKKAEELAKQQEAERKKAEEAKKAEELAKQQEAERKKAEELAKQQEAERKKAEEEAKKNQANDNPAPPAASSSFTDALAKGFIANHPRKDRADYMDPNKVGGIILSINNTGGTLTGQSPKTDTFDELMVNGTKIVLLGGSTDKLNLIGMRPLAQRDFPDGGYKAEGKGWVGSTGDERQGVFQNVRYGVYSVDGQSHLFVQGKPTLSMYLTSGRYSYDGHAVYGKDGQYRRAKTNAVVDFGKKTIDVTITPQGISGQIAPSPLKFGGVIKGNTFSGTQNNIETKGGFFGDGAADLGGVYHATGGEHAGYNGAYGASDRVRKND
ncbi:transferrin-binding protein-like solute binding protein [Neisseria dumasiana]|uniref:Transferrin-binding protein B C-lobe/N-lobe beta-barrel domain-containing protein n=1 Tax=Neisseria dumasiana TaxID=1931275 RepID=A0ABX3WQ22_9NEIS|nr:transferrin-binding protein-like solute binding protein [Neisseria dumasiana]OSI36349.1 hypothetical protein BV913_02570 [Neisseria dumasiana]UOO84151.1 transferrin-binding protein-like solute binding protein [Neisseria dumasiana]